jgi:purine-binding chemotaxis protein CheW
MEPRQVMVWRSSFESRSECDRLSGVESLENEYGPQALRSIFRRVEAGIAPGRKSGRNERETMTDAFSKQSRSLVVGVKGRLCAVPLTHVIEIMRPLSVEPISDVPPFVQGISVIRGIPTPVVDLGALLGMPTGVANRFVTLRVGERQVALSVDSVLGVRGLDLSKIGELPPLLQGASNDAIEAMGTLDEQLLVVLRAGWELPDEVWQTLTAQEVAS